MGWLEAILLGAVQGFTEYLPISSSGHLRVLPELFGWRDPGAAFTAVTQIGTLLAILVYFRHDIVLVTKTWFLSLWLRPDLRRDISARMGWYVVVGTVPLVVAGVLFEDAIYQEWRSLWVVASMTVGLGVLLWVADIKGRRTRMLGEVRMRDAVLVGASQMLAVIPGASRSGVTLTAALLLGMTREAAARFSFLLSIPAVLASAVWTVKDIGEPAAPGQAATAWGPTILATVVAFVVGYASIAWLLRWLATHSTFVFMAYRVVFGGLLFVLLGTGVLAGTA